MKQNIKINLVVPYHRTGLKEKLFAHLEPMGITLHLIDDTKINGLKWPSWVRRHEAFPPRGWDACYWKINWFADHTPIHDDEYYHLMGDDDLPEPGYFDFVRKHDGPVIITSIHYLPGIDMLACPDNMRIGCVGLRQYLVRGDIFRQHRHINATHGDGDFCEQLYRDHSPLDYAPEAFVRYNALEHDRWNYKKKYEGPFVFGPPLENPLHKKSPTQMQFDRWTLTPIQVPSLSVPSATGIRT